MEEYQRNVVAAQGYCELRMYGDALAELDAIPRGLQEDAVVVEMRLVTLMQAKRWEEALACGLKLCALRPDANSGYIHSAFCLHELGRTEEARQRLLQGPPSLQQEANFFYNMACYECVLGHHESARRYLARSFALEAKYRGFAKADPDLAGLRAST